jgi:uncharacterized Zn finger protein/DNA-binding transcriptional regulator YiaG
MALWGGWRRYVPVAERRAKARREMDKLRKKGQDIQPVSIDGRTIARSFWGKGWCDHLESFADYANRLPRGRTYVRNGSVCHLDIRPGRIEAVVSGSELYQVVIRITELKAATWTSIKDQCAGHIGSMLELLQGKLSDQVMAIVTNRQHGLFPLPGEMALDCRCPDGAGMCKHVAAVLYGVGSRLDSRPELLFLLRDVDAQELIAAEMALPDAAASAAGDTLAADQLGAIFGIDLDTESDTPPAPQTHAKKRPQSPPRATKHVAAPTTRQPAPAGQVRKTAPAAPPAGRSRQAAHTGTRREPSPPPTTTHVRTSAKVATSTPPKMRPTGKSIAQLRRQQGLTVAQFAVQLGVSAATVYRWEAIQGPLNLQARLLDALAALQQRAKKSVGVKSPGGRGTGPGAV